jgi:hypothetical protein
MGGAISAAVARVPGRDQPGRAGRLAVHAGLIALVVALSAAGSRPTLRPAIFRLLGGRSATLGAAPALCGAVLSRLRGAVAVPCRAVGGARDRQHGGVVAPLGAGLGEAMPLSGALGLRWGPFPRLGMAELAGGLIGAFAIGAIIAVGRACSAARG